MFENYDKKSHAHCWTSENPPCGKKAHARCCLCEEIAPNIMKELEVERAEGEERIKEWQKVKIAPNFPQALGISPSNLPPQGAQLGMGNRPTPPTNDWETDLNIFLGYAGFNDLISESNEKDILRNNIRVFVKTLLKSKAVEIEETIEAQKNRCDNAVMTQEREGENGGLNKAIQIIKSKLL